MDFQVGDIVQFRREYQAPGEHLAYLRIKWIGKYYGDRGLAGVFPVHQGEDGRWEAYSYKGGFEVRLGQLENLCWWKM